MAQSRSFSPILRSVRFQVIAVIVALVAACWRRHDLVLLGWTPAVDPLLLAVAAVGAVLGTIRQGGARRFWYSFGVVGVIYLQFIGGMLRVAGWFADVGMALRLRSLGVTGYVIVNALDGLLTALVAVLGGLVSWYLLPDALRVVRLVIAHPSRLWFTSNILLRAMALFAVASSLPLWLVPLSWLCLAFSLLGMTVAHLLEMQPKRRQVIYTASFGAAGGLVTSPLQIGIAEGPGHPWPAPDTLLIDYGYAGAIIVGCVLVGGAVGFLTWHALNLRIGRRADAAEMHAGLTPAG